MKRNLFQAAVRHALLVFALMGGPIAKAQGDSDPCSLRSLRGSYGFVVEGEILSVPGMSLPPGVRIPVRAVAMIEFDGKGKLSVVDHFVINGQAPPTEWSSGTGTYTVNGNCTGTMEIVKTGVPPAVNRVVIVQGGKEVRGVLVGDAVTSVGKRIE